MTIRQDEAIILRTRDYRESDRLITFFSRSQGQLTGIAKGARRSKKRFVHTLEPLSHVLITYADRSSSGLVRIDASELKNGFIELRNDVTRLGYASLSCEFHSKTMEVLYREQISEFHRRRIFLNLPPNPRRKFLVEAHEQCLLSLACKCQRTMNGKDCFT